MDDERALRATLAGDTSAFGVVVRRHQAAALRVASMVTRDPDLAQEAAQRGFVRAFERLETFDVRRPFEPWLLTIVRREGLMLLRRRGRERGGSPSEVMGSTRAVAEESLGVREALARLAPADRDLIVAKHLEGLTYDELALRLGIPRGTVMSRLFTARQRLKACLEDDR